MFQDLRQYSGTLLLCVLLFVALFSQLGSNIWPLLLVVSLGLVGVAVAYSIIVGLVYILVGMRAEDPAKFVHVNVYSITSGDERFDLCKIARRYVVFGRIFYIGKVGKLACRGIREGWCLTHPAFKNGELEVTWMASELSLSFHGYELVQE